MRRIALFIIFLLALSIPLGSQEADPRLAQPVTVECANMRLYAALDKISKQTGVSLRCGRNRDDWQVREIPVTVCVRDVPLGKLLNLIAESTHLLLSCEEVGDSKVYRIWRDGKRQSELDKFFQSRLEAEENWAKWEWDATAKYKDLPDHMLGSTPKDPGHAFARALSRLIAALGPSWRNLIMEEETLKLGLKNAWPALQDALKDLFKAESQTNPDPKSEGKQLTDEDMQKYVIAIYRDESGQITTPIRNPYGSTWHYSLNTVTSQNILEEGRKAAGLPTQSRPPEPSYAVDESGNYKSLNRRTDWEMPALKEQVTLVKPEGKDLTCSDLISALSKAGGYSIVCEDFESHRRLVKVEGLFKGETTIGAVLRALDRLGVGHDKAGFVWHINDKEKVILGTANMWPYHHINLVPESLLAGLRAKLNGDGVTLDDYVPLLSLTHDQVVEWIGQSPDLQMLAVYGRPAFPSFWVLYGSLDLGSKFLAQSKAGLPLKNLHSDMLVNAAKEHNHARDHIAAQDMSTLGGFSGEGFKTEGATIGEPAVLPDPVTAAPEQLAWFVMKVRKTPAIYYRQSFWQPGGDLPAKEGWVKTFAYDLILETRDGEIKSTIDGPIGLPMYSPEREKALGIEPTKDPPAELQGLPGTN